MMNKILGQLLAACVAGLALTSAAAAQNYDGNGLIRFGIFGGGEFYDLKRNPANPIAPDTSMDGGMVGFSAGYDLIFARQLLVGIEGDVQVGDTRGRVPGTAVNAHADYLATLRGRAGFYVHPNFLIYGTGGVAWAGLGIENSFATAVAGQVDSNKAAVGWIAGGGLEYDMRDSFGMILFGEYLVGSFNGWNNLPGLGSNLDTDVQTFRVGVKFKLGHDYYDDRRGRYEPLK